MKRVLFAGTALAVLTAGAVAWADMDPIKARQTVMKNNGAAIGAMAKMAKGEIPFDPLAVDLALRVMYDSPLAVATLFPPGSDKGDTKASPKIWEDMAGFQAEAAKLEDAVTKVMATPITDVDGVKAALGVIGPICGECHETYRIKSN
jgi:cytochrome c556